MHTEIAAADRRLKQQLKHDREQAAELQESQLRRDRKLREIEAARSTLDDVLNLVNETLEAVSRLFALNKVHHELKQELDAIDPSESEGPKLESLSERLTENNRERVEALGKSGRLLRDGLATQLRLRLRFPDDSPIVQTFWAWHSAVKGWYDQVAEFGSSRETSDELLDEIPKTGFEAGERLGEFLEAARQWSKDPEPN